MFSATSTLTIVGAGPIGLEAAAWAARRNWDVAVFEKTRVGHHIRQWGHVQLFSPFSMNHSSWGPELIRNAFPRPALPAEEDYLTGLEFVERYLEPLARVPLLRERIHTGVEVVEIGRDQIAKKDSIGKEERSAHPFRLLLRRGDREWIHRTGAVIDASGVYSCPHFLGSGNIPAPGEQSARSQAPSRLQYGIVDVLGKDRPLFENKRVLLVGGGHSAATALEAFLELHKSAAETRVFWVNRSPYAEPYYLFPNDPLPYRDRLSRLGNGLATRPLLWLRYWGGSSIEAITRWPQRHRQAARPDGFEVVIDSPSGYQQLEVDQIVACVGFRPDNSLYRQLQVHECYATGGPIKLAATLLGGSPDCLAQPSQGLDALKNPEPDFFIVGNKSYGTHTTFLLTHGIRQVETVLEHLEKKARLEPQMTSGSTVV